MGSLSVLAGVLIVLLIWIVRTRSALNRWVQLLDLPGIWELESSDEIKVSIEFFGTLKNGQYIESLHDKIVAGNWKLTGSKLVLAPNQQAEQMCEIRSFDVGRIGIHGLLRDKQIYQKRANNVVPMRRST